MDLARHRARLGRSVSIMEEKDLIEELKSCLALQEEIDAKTLKLRGMSKITN